MTYPSNSFTSLFYSKRHGLVYRFAWRTARAWALLPAVLSPRPRGRRDRHRERGLRNRITLSKADEAVLRQFHTIERMNTKRCLEWRLERLRYKLDVARAAQLEARTAQFESSVDFAHTEVRQLRMARAIRTWNPFRRLLAWMRHRRQRSSPDTGSSES